jgi:hypothetical protein
MKATSRRQTGCLFGLSLVLLVLLCLADGCKKDDTLTTSPIPTYPSIGQGSVQAFPPIWLRKSWGKFTTYGGGGFWYNPGAQSRNWVFAGWQVRFFGGGYTRRGVLLP